VTTELTIIVPTFNERDNIQSLVDSLDKVLTGIKWEVIFVDDDSPDKTSSVVRKIASRDPRIRCLQRIKRRGLSSACIEGMLASSSPYLCVMDADMQHDETLIPKMYSAITNDGYDMVIGSRYVEQGSTGQLASHRVFVSKVATKLGHLILKEKVADPMSGFFMLSRSFFEKVMHKVSGKGFKILLDMLISKDFPISLKEIPYKMRTRTYGESKLNFLVAWDFIILILNQVFGTLFPVRFVSFITVGFTGLLLHLFILWILYEVSSLNFTVSQASATLIAMTSNYILNNQFTYHDKKQTGKLFWRGLLSFYLACTFGALINVVLAGELYERQIPWFISGMTGAVVGAIWNYAVTSVFTWGDKAKI
jgi:dolichol-phosphate mannosyltransferase